MIVWRRHQAAAVRCTHLTCQPAAARAGLLNSNGWQGWRPQELQGHKRCKSCRSACCTWRLQPWRVRGRTQRIVRTWPCGRRHSGLCVSPPVIQPACTHVHARAASAPHVQWPASALVRPLQQQQCQPLALLLQAWAPACLLLRPPPKRVLPTLPLAKHPSCPRSWMASWRSACVTCLSATPPLSSRLCRCV